MSLYFKKGQSNTNKMIRMVFDNNLRSAFQNFGRDIDDVIIREFETININKYFTLNTKFFVRITLVLDNEFINEPLFDECSFTLVFSKSLL